MLRHYSKQFTTQFYALRHALPTGCIVQLILLTHITVQSTMTVMQAFTMLALLQQTRRRACVQTNALKQYQQHECEKQQNYNKSAAGQRQAFTVIATPKCCKGKPTHNMVLLQMFCQSPHWDQAGHREVNNLASPG